MTILLAHTRQRWYFFVYTSRLRFIFRFPTTTQMLIEFIFESTRENQRKDNTFRFLFQRSSLISHLSHDSFRVYFRRNSLISHLSRTLGTIIYEETYLQAEHPFGILNCGRGHTVYFWNSLRWSFTSGRESCSYHPLCSFIQSHHFLNKCPLIIWIPLEEVFYRNFRTRS